MPDRSCVFDLNETKDAAKAVLVRFVRAARHTAISKPPRFYLSDPQYIQHEDRQCGVSFGDDDRGVSSGACQNIGVGKPAIWMRLNG